MRNIYFLIILLGMTFAVMPVTDSALAVEKQVKGSSNALIVGTELDYPPYSFLDEEGRPSGFNVALTQAIAKAMGLNIEVRIGPWADIRKGLKEGKKVIGTRLRNISVNIPTHNSPMASVRNVPKNFIRI